MTTKRRKKRFDKDEGQEEEESTFQDDEEDEEDEEHTTTNLYQRNGLVWEDYRLFQIQPGIYNKQIYPTAFTTTRNITKELYYFTARHSASLKEWAEVVKSSGCIRILDTLKKRASCQHSTSSDIRLILVKMLIPCSTRIYNRFVLHPILSWQNHTHSHGLYCWDSFLSKSRIALFPFAAVWNSSWWRQHESSCTTILCCTLAGTVGWSIRGDLTSDRTICWI